MWNPLFVSLWCGVLFAPSFYAYPSGAPKSACRSMTPHHPPGIKSQSSSSPYVAFVDAVNTPSGSFVRGHSFCISSDTTSAHKQGWCHEGVSIGFTDNDTPESKMSCFWSTANNRNKVNPMRSKQNQNQNYACAHTDSTTKKMALVAAAVFLVILAEVWVVSIFVGVAAFPNGAPVSACSDLTPFHGARLSGFAIEEIVDRPAPYVLKTNQIDSNLYGGVISGNIPFKAFMVQARIDGSQKVVGKFIRFEKGLTKTLTCSQSDDTITHTNDNPKQQITFVWHVDDLDIPESRIHFVATVAKSYSEFWTNVTSEAITIGSPIKEMTQTVSPNQSVPGGRWGPGSPAKPPLKTQANQKNHQQKRHQWQQSPDALPLLESEGLPIPPEVASLMRRLPIPSSDSWQRQDFGPDQFMAPNEQIEPNTVSIQTPVLQLNTSHALEAPNLSVETVGRRPSQDGWNNNPSTTQSRGQQRVTEISRSTKQTTPASVDATRIKSAAASNNFKLSLYFHVALFTLMLFL